MRVLDGDGDGADWADVSGTRVNVRSTRQDAKASTDDVLVKAGIHGEYVYLYLEWRDPKPDELHKPWVWDDVLGKYVTGSQREDRLALQFEMTGDYGTDWFSGNSFTADMWHWKASRTNPLGLAHDKRTVVSTQKLLRAYRAQTPQGNPVYLTRPSDDGAALYRSKRYRSRVEPLMPKYLLSDEPSGSIADIEAKGVWFDGMWRLDLRRKLETGHDDDVVFTRGRAVRGGIAIFKSSENEDHMISDTLVFQF